MSFPINFSTVQPSMSEFFKAELKDKFLQYASERDDYFEVQLLYDEFLRPNYSLQFVEKLVREIMDYNPDLFDIMSGNGSKIFMLSATANTEEFVEEGGFKDIFVAEEEKWDIFIDQLTNTRKLTTEEKVNLGKTEKTSFKRERKLLFVLIGAVAVSFLYTLFSIFNDFFLKKQQPVELENRIVELQNQNSKEREILVNEIKDLKSEIAKMQSSKVLKK
jgi:hypothetical protein